MNFTIRLTLSFVLLTGFAGGALAGGVNERLDIAELRRDPQAFAGRIVEVQARVIAINADGVVSRYSTRRVTREFPSCPKQSESP